MEAKNSDNNNQNERLEVGEILARLNAGVISREEAQTALEKFNTSPTRVIEQEDEDSDQEMDISQDQDHATIDQGKFKFLQS